MNNQFYGQDGYGQQLNNQGYNNGYDQTYNNGYQQNYGQNNMQNTNYQQQYYDYQPMSDCGFTLKVNKYDPNNEANGRELFCIATGNGNFFTKKGAMVGYQGQFKLSKRLLGTNDGNIVGQVMNHLGRKITGENLEIMEVKGSGTIFLADDASHITVVDLNPGESLCVESEDLLAFTKSCHYGVCCVPMGTLSQKGLFTSKLTGQGVNSQVAIKTKGNPLMLQTPCSVDPDALVAWTGPSPHFGVDVNIKNLIGQASGESYRFDFNQPGHIVIIQPFERKSGLKVSINDKTYRPNGQGSAYQNSKNNFRGMTAPNQAGNVGESLGKTIGNMMGNIFN